MPLSCAVGGCTRNWGKNPGLNWLSFPKNVATRREWIRFVNNTRSDFVVSESSKICSAHFAEVDVDETVRMKRKMGMSTRFKLREGAVPTIKAPTVATSTTTMTTCIASSSGETPLALAPPLTRPTTTKIDGHRKSGGAFFKRERARILQEVHEQYSESAASSPDVGSSMDTDDEGSSIKHASVQTTSSTLTINLDVVKVDIYPQHPPKRIFFRSRRSQTDPRKFSVRHKRIQMAPERASKRIQCELVKAPKLKPLSQVTVCESHHAEMEVEEEMECVHVDVQGPSSSSYEVSSTPSSDSHYDVNSDDQLDEEEPGALDEKKYLVFESNLLQLFTRCSYCAGPSKRRLHRPYGGMMVEIIQTCKIKTCGHIKRWRSQPMVGNVTAGNIMMSAAILMSGVSIKKFINALTSINIAMISYSTFFVHQNRYLQPAIVDIWHAGQEAILTDMEASGQDGFLGMDMRADSMGHSAKFGCYSVVELNQGKVLHIELVQKSETQNKSNLMEKEGLVRAVQWLDKKEVKIGTIVTDRHRQVTKYIREKLCPRGIKHFYDVWHVAKGLKKKLTSAANASGCEAIRPWIQGVVNNLYWVAASTPDGDGDLMLAKFSSVANHVLNIHHHDNPLFPLCAHGDLEDREWLTPGSTAANKITAVLDNTWMRKDVKKLSPSMQTSSVEGFHSVINQYAPKMFAFSYEGMLCRIYMAAMHFNENSGRQQAKDKHGDPAYSVQFPRAKQTTGGYSVRKVLIECTYQFNKRIMEKVLELCEAGENTRANHPELMCNPGPLTATVTRPNKEEAVRAFISRFGNLVEPVGRPAGCEGVVVPERVERVHTEERVDKKKKNKKNKKAGGKKSMKSTKRKPESEGGPSDTCTRKHRKK